MANSVDPDEKPHSAVSHQSLHYFRATDNFWSICVFQPSKLNWVKPYFRFFVFFFNLGKATTKIRMNWVKLGKKERNGTKMHYKHGLSLYPIKYYDSTCVI